MINCLIIYSIIFLPVMIVIMTYKINKQDKNIFKLMEIIRKRKIMLNI